MANSKRVNCQTQQKSGSRRKPPVRRQCVLQFHTLFGITLALGIFVDILLFKMILNYIHYLNKQPIKYDLECITHFKWMGSIPEFHNTSIDSTVRDSGSCNASSILAVIDALEIALKIKRNRSVTLSAQTILDCLKYRQICEKGVWPGPALDFLAFHGVPLEQDNPFRREQTFCSRYKPYAYAKDTCLHYRPERVSDFEIQSLMLNAGVTVACVDGNSPDFRHLRRPIFTGRCEDTCNHVVLLKGWTPTHWVVRNSWGVGWGDGTGHALLPRTGPNTCGVTRLTGAVWPALATDTNYLRPYI